MAHANPAGEGSNEGLWRFRALLVAVFVFPLLTFTAVAWVDRAGVLAQAEREAAEVAEISAQNALNVLQTHELVASVVSEHIAGMSWADIGSSAAVHEYLARVDDAYPQMKGIWLVDRFGVIRNSSRLFPIDPVSVADRDYFVALRDHDSGIFIGELVLNRVFGEPNFNIARRRTSANGEFDGLVVVTAVQSHLAKFWQAVSPAPGNVTALVRADGMILARQPEIRPEAARLPPNSLVLRATRSGVERGMFRATSPVDGVERFYALRRIDGYDEYIVHGVAVATALARWYADLRLLGSVFAIAGVALTFTAALALRQAQRERVATARWRSAAQLADDELQRRTAVEAQLRQSQKLEALGQMAGSIAHDFGNLLTVVIGNLDRLKARLTDPEFMRPLRSASDAAERGAQAIRALLAFARRQPLRQETCDLNVTLQSMRPLLQQGLGARCQLVLDLAAETWPVTVDVNQLEMAMLNLTVNGRDAMPKGGTLRIATVNTRLNGDPPGLDGEFVRLSVADSGTGMPPDIAARVFEPFFTTKPAGKGTGLGLSQVYGFATQCGGTATLDSIVDHGTTISLYLPRARSDASSDTVAGGGGADTGNGPRGTAAVKEG